MLIFWIFIFIVSLSLMIKSSDWLVESAEKIGFAFKISPFIIGVTIVAIGTSFPEMASSVVARTLIVRKSLIDLDAPLLKFQIFFNF